MLKLGLLIAIHFGQFCYSYDKMRKQIFHNKKSNFIEVSFEWSHYWNLWSVQTAELEPHCTIHISLPNSLNFKMKLVHCFP